MTETIELLKECDSGCKMAINSMKQVMEYVKNDKQAKLIDESIKEHQNLEEEIGRELVNYGKEEKEPGLMASAMSWFSTDFKMLLNNDAHQIAKIMMDGCNMGIQSVSEYINKYSSATDESIRLAKDIIRVEEDFVKEMRQFL